MFSSLQNGPHPLYVPIIMLVVDCVLYLLLAIYLDQVLPGKVTNTSKVTLFPYIVVWVHWTDVVLLLMQVNME